MNPVDSLRCVVELFGIASDIALDRLDEAAERVEGYVDRAIADLRRAV